MGFLQENANVKLFLLIVVVAGITVALTVVYQESFKDINQRYYNKLAELNSTFKQLEGTKLVLNRTVEDLELKNAREETLEEQYEGVKKRRDYLESENTDIKKELQEKTIKLQDATAELDKVKNELKGKEEKIESLEEEIDKLRREVSCLRAGNANC